MPPRSPASGGSLRRIVLSLCAVALALGVYAFLELGSFFANEDPLQKADAIMALAGSTMVRQLEAADLYLAGYGGRIILSRQPRDGGELALAKRGIPFPEDIERVRAVFMQLGIPEDAILVPERIHNNTAAEAVTVRELSGRYGWRQVIVVSSTYHLRRAAFALRRELRGTEVDVIMRGSRYDRANPERWWTSRSDVREIVAEAPRLVAYVLGLGA